MGVLAVPGLRRPDGRAFLIAVGLWAVARSVVVTTRRAGSSRARSGRSGPVYDPATGREARRVDFASAEEVDAAVASAKAAFPGVARDVALEAHRDPVPHSQPGGAAPSRDRRAADGRARQGALRRARRGGPRAREHRVLDRHPAAAERWFQRAGVGRRRRLPDPPAAGCRRRYHALQLPGDGADVDVRQRDRVRQHVRAQAVGEGSVRVALHRRVAGRSGRSAGVFNVVQGDKVAVDRILEHPDIKAVSFVGSTPIARYIYETGTRHGKRVQALGGAKNHMVVLPDADLDMAADAPFRRPTAAPASAAWRSPWWSPWARSETRWWARSRSGCRASTSGRARSRRADGAAGHPRAPRQGRLVPRQGRAAGRDGCRRR